MIKDILSYWPHENFREGQDKITTDISQALQKKKFVILEAPPGRGKSPIAVALGSWFRSSFIVTSQKLLQAQYQRNYEEKANLKVVKGKNNYECGLNGKTVDKGYCTSSKDVIGQCKQRGLCPYYKAKEEAEISDICLTNYSYFLAMMNSFKPFSKRKLLVCDEAHLIEQEVLDYVQFSISTRSLSFTGKTIKIPVYENVEDYKPWLYEINAEVLNEINNIKEEISLTKLEPSNQYFDQKINRQRLTPLAEEKFDILNNTLERLEKTSDKILKMHSYINNETWVFELEDRSKSKAIVFKPVVVSNFATNYLFNHADRIFLMSATIRDHKLFTENLGIQDDEYEYFEMPSNFPVENRKIHLVNSGSFAQSKLNDTLKEAKEDIKGIINHHEDVKGIIHTHTYKISKYIRESHLSDRFIFHDSDDREQAYRKHLRTKEPTILVTPSMTVGFDFPDDLARFQIICKVPYPYLGDKRVRKRREVQEGWYALITALSLIQTYGRSIRSKDDWAITYVLDTSINWFIKSNLELFPKYFLEALE